MKSIVRLLTVVEIEVDASDPSPVGCAQQVLDLFRESVLPSENYGITLYRAVADDLSRELLEQQFSLSQVRE